MTSEMKMDEAIRPTKDRTISNGIDQMTPIKKGQSEEESACEDALWLQNYNTLVEFHAKHGHANVLRSDPNKKLSGWVKRQRDNLKANKLSNKRTNALNKLNFVWNRISSKWDGKYLRLLKYQEQFGDCNVRSQVDRSLAEWVQRQRREFRDGLPSMTQHRVDQLEKVPGWHWGFKNPFDAYLHKQLRKIESSQ